MVKKMKISLAIAFFYCLEQSETLGQTPFLDQRQQYYWLKFQHSSEVCEHLEWLFMIISLGYRLRQVIATRFHRWATERIKEYIIKGFTEYRPRGMRNHHTVRVARSISRLPFAGPGRRSTVKPAD